MSRLHTRYTSDTSERINLLDSLRGFALFGILFGNFTWFTGYAVSNQAERSQFATANLDTLTTWWIHFAVDGKFYSLFALLFGIGFGLQAKKAPHATTEFSKLFVRRMVILFTIGALHATCLWFGDILSLYAVTGLALLGFRSLATDRLLPWACVFLLTPILFYLSWLFIHIFRFTTSTPNADPGYGPGDLLPTFGLGTYAQISVANWAFLKERWILAFQSGRFFKLLGMFLLGLWVVRKNVLFQLQDHRKTLTQVLVIALAVGIPMNIVLGFLLEFVPERPPSVPGFLRATIYSLAAPTLALAYATGFCLLYQTRSRGGPLRLLRFAGRMSLTNYLVQTLFGVGLFYGYGVGLWGRISVSWSVPLVTAIFGLQCVFSYFWLQRFAMGPVEWVWRCLTHRKRLPLRPLPPRVQEASI